MFSGFTFGGEANRENSVVLMLTERGLILNLPIKTEEIDWQSTREKCCSNSSNSLDTQTTEVESISAILNCWQCTIWLGGPGPPGELGTGRGSESLQKQLKRKDSSAWTSSPETQNKYCQFAAHKCQKYILNIQHPEVLPTLLSLTGVAPKSRGKDVSTGSLGHLRIQKGITWLMMLM